MSDNLPVGFFFGFIVNGMAGGEGVFQEASGLSMALNPEEIKEAGNYHFEHRFPMPPKYENIVFKSGMIIGNNLILWIKMAFEQSGSKPHKLTVTLYDELKQPLAGWSLIDAYPVAIKMSDFKSNENAVVVETLELAYSYFTRVL